MTFYSASSSAGTATGTAVTHTLPTWTVAGGSDLILLWVSSSVSSTIPTPTGYQVLIPKFGTTPCAALFYRPADPGGADSGASVSLTLGTAGSWTVASYVCSDADGYGVDVFNSKNGSTASTSASFTPLTTGYGTTDTGLGIEFTSGQPGSGQTDTLTVPTGYGNSIAVATTKSASVNTSTMVCSVTSATYTGLSSYTPPTVTQSVSVKYVNAWVNVVKGLTPTAAPLAAYNFNEGSGTTTADATGNGLTLAVPSGAWATGFTGGGYSVPDGVQTTALSPWVTFPSELTISFKFKDTSTGIPGYCAPLKIRTVSGSQDALIFQVQGLGSYVFEPRHHSAGGGDGGLGQGFNADQSQWHRVSMNIQTTGSGYVQQLSMDGNFVGATGGPWSGDTLSDAGSSVLLFLGDEGGGANGQTIVLDDLRFYGYNQTWREQIYDMAHTVGTSTTTWNGTVGLAVGTSLALTPIDTLNPTISLAAATALSVTSLVTRPQTVGLAVGVGLAATPLVTHPATTPLAVATQLAVTPQVTYQQAVAFNAATALVVTPQATYQPLIPLAVATTLNASTGAGTQTGTVPLAVGTALATTPVLTFQPTLSMAVATALGVTPLVTHSATTLMAVSSALTTTAVNTYQPLVPLIVGTSLSTTAQATYNVVLPLSVATALNATPPTTRTATLNLIVQTVLGLVPDSGHHPIAVTLWTGAVESPLVLAGWWNGVHLIPLTIDGKWNGVTTV